MQFVDPFISIKFFLIVPWGYISFVGEHPDLEKVYRDLLFVIVFACVFSLFFANVPASASSSANGGYPYDVSIGSDGHVWFLYSGTQIGSHPACAGSSVLWAIDASTAGGQAILSGLLTALPHQSLSSCDLGMHVVGFLPLASALESPSTGIRGASRHVSYSHMVR